jgi:hypothetical protein
MRAIVPGNSPAAQDPTTNPALMNAGAVVNLLFRFAHSASIAAITKSPEFPAIRAKHLQVLSQACRDARRRGFDLLATTLLSVKTAVEIRAHALLHPKSREEELDPKTLARLKITDHMTRVPPFRLGHRRVRSTDAPLPGMSECGYIPSSTSLTFLTVHGHRGLGLESVTGSESYPALPVPALAAH